MSKILDPLSSKPIVLVAAIALAGACGETQNDAPPSDAPADLAVAVPRFTDVLAESGITFRHHFLDSESGSTYRINPYDHGSGVCVADVNGDGLEDVYFLDFLGPNALYLNRGGMKFEDVTARAGVAVERALSVGGAFGDYDGDGDPDLYVTTYRGGNHLFRNRGDGTFEDVTDAAGLAYTGHSNSATWFDYDLDGDADLYLCNVGKFTTETISEEADYFYSGVALPFGQVVKTPDKRVPGEGNVLYRNDGDGKFTNVTDEAGVGAGEWNGDAAVADFDLDGDLDLYVSNMFGANHLYRNEGAGRFAEVTESVLGRTSWGGMGARFFDANGDEFPDLYVVDMHSDMWVDPEKEFPRGFDAAAKFNTPLGASVGGGKAIAKADDTQARSALFGNTFFAGAAGGAFVESSAAAGLENWWPWGIAVGDFNDDGAEDLFVTAGMGFPFRYWPNLLLVNRGNGTFADVAARAGIEPPSRGTTIPGASIRGKELARSSRCAAIADFDGDGDLDLAVNNFNHEPYLLRNDSPKGNALRLRLRGTKASRDAVGARVRVTAGGKTWSRMVTGSQGYLTQSSPIVHVGLGARTSVDSVEVFWPGAKEPQRVPVAGLGTVVDVVQE